MAKKNNGLRYFATASMTGIIRGYDQKIAKVKSGKNQGDNFYNDSFNIHVGDNRFMVVKKYGENNLSYKDKDGVKTETFLAKDIKKIREITKTNDESLYTINVVPYFSSYTDNDGGTKIRRLPELRGFDKVTKPSESATFVARGVVNKIKEKSDKTYEVELGFIETSETDDGNIYYYKWFNVFVTEDVMSENDDIICIGNFISVAGRNYNCFDVDEFGHIEGDSKTGYYVEKVYKNECKEKEDMEDEEVDLYKRVKKAEKIDERVKKEEVETKSSKPVKPAKPTRKFEEEDEDDV